VVAAIITAFTGAIPALGHDHGHHQSYSAGEPGEPGAVEVKRGEQIRFVLRNARQHPSRQAADRLDLRRADPGRISADRTEISNSANLMLDEPLLRTTMASDIVAP
jgi:hypothetical protein